MARSDRRFGGIYQNVRTFACTFDRWDAQFVGSAFALLGHCAYHLGEIRQGLERGDLAVLTIAEPETDRFAGSLVLFGITAEEAEVGFWLHPLGRGRGLAADALDLAAEFARRSGLLRLTARTLPENEASQRVLERCGYIRGARTRTVTPSGADALAVHYSRDLG